MPKGIVINQEFKQQIVDTYKSGLTYREVADKLGISFATVGRIVRESGYDRFHVGSKIAKSIPTPEPLKVREQPSKPSFVTLSRTMKLHSEHTDYNYTISTDSDQIDIESDTALMSIKLEMIDQFIKELQDIKAMLGSPS